MDIGWNFAISRCGPFTPTGDARSTRASMNWLNGKSSRNSPRSWRKAATGRSALRNGGRCSFSARSSPRPSPPSRCSLSAAGAAGGPARRHLDHGRDDPGTADRCDRRDDRRRHRRRKNCRHHGAAAGRGFHGRLRQFAGGARGDDAPFLLGGLLPQLRARARVRPRRSAARDGARGSARDAGCGAHGSRRRRAGAASANCPR
jgi:hypothetical protein